jgi:hypothetical protein
VGAVSSGQSIEPGGVASPDARRSIARFQGGAWTIGAIVMAVIAFGTFARLEWNADTGTLRDTADGNAYGDYPWEDETLPEVEITDGGGYEYYSGTGNAVIRVEDVTTEPLQVTQVSDVYVDLHMTESGDIDPETLLPEAEWPLDVGSPQPELPVVIFPYEGTLELWVESDDPWTLQIEELDAEEITDVVSGQGNALLVYRGSAVSALFEFAGDGIFFVTAYTREEGQESIIIESDPLKERHSWSPSDIVVLSIESDADRGAWVVDIDDYEDEDEESTPAPAPTSPASPAPDDTTPPTEQETS